MIGYKYNGFVIKQYDFSRTKAWCVFKDDALYSCLHFTTPDIAKKVIDLVLPQESKPELKPFNY